jgi:hypothetical protein
MEMPTILRGSAKGEKFVLGKDGIAFGSNDPSNNQYWNVQDELDDDTLIIGFDPSNDTIVLSGTQNDYLIRPTSRLDGTVGLAIILTDRYNRIMRSGEGNELTTIAWIVPPLGTSLSSYAEEIGLARDPYDYDNRGYYTDSLGKVLSFEGDGVPARSGQGGFIEPNNSEIYESAGKPAEVISISAEINESEQGNLEVRSSLDPGTKLYYKVVGKGVNQKDFVGAKAKGAIAVNDYGIASLSFVIKADKATEGTETFCIKIYKDKKMKSLLAQSDSASILDTSSKVIKNPTRNNSNKPPLDAKDSVTGLYWETGDYGTMVSDKYYDKNSGSIVIEKSPSIEAFELELSNDLIITTSRAADDFGKYIYRNAYSGKFAYREGRLSSGVVDSYAVYTHEVNENGIYEEVEIYSYPSPIVLQSTQSISAFNQAVSIDDIPRSLYRGKENGVLLPTQAATEPVHPRRRFTDGSFEEIYSFGGGAVFSENWWLNPFAPNLI